MKKFLLILDSSSPFDYSMRMLARRFLARLARLSLGATGSLSPRLSQSCSSSALLFADGGLDGIVVEIDIDLRDMCAYFLLFCDLLGGLLCCQALCFCFLASQTFSLFIHSGCEYRFGFFRLVAPAEVDSYLQSAAQQVGLAHLVGAEGAGSHDAD